MSVWGEFNIPSSSSKLPHIRKYMPEQFSSSGGIMPSPTIYSFTLKDARGVKATTTGIYVAYDAATETVGALTGNLAALGGLIDAITDAQIIDARIIIDVAPDPAWKSAPVANSDVQESFNMNFLQDNSKYVQSVLVPGLKNSILVNGAPAPTASPLSTFITNMTTSIGGSSTVFANSKYLNALNALSDVFITFRPHRRQTKQRTLKPGS